MQNPHFNSKSKIPKKCHNPFYKSFILIVCNKQLEKTPNIREMRQFSISAIMHRLKPMQNAHFGSKIKIAKHLKIHSTNYLELFCAKNCSKKHQIFEK